MSDLFHLIEDRMAVREIDGDRPNTIRTKRQILRAWSRQLGDRDVTDATRADVRAFLAKPGLSSNTRSQYLTTLRVFYRWAMDEGHVTVDPTEGVRGPKFKAGLPRPIPVNHLQAALKTAAPNVRLWMLLGAYQGLRCCEMAELRGEDFDFSGETPTMLIHGKGGKVALLPIHPVLVDELKVRGARPGWVFPHKWVKGDHVLAGSISKLVNNHLRGMGIDSTAHALRHLFGTSIYQESGYDLRLTQELLRHASPSTTAIYTKVDRKNAGVVLSRLKFNTSTSSAYGSVAATAASVTSVIEVWSMATLPMNSLGDFVHALMRLAI